MGGHEQPLVEGLVAGGAAAHLPAQAGGGKAGFDAFDRSLRARQIRPGGGQPAPRVFDQAAHAHVRAEVGGLVFANEFPVAVIHHDENVRADSVHGLHGFLHFLGPQGRPPGVAPAALDQNHPGVGLQRRQHAGHVDLRLIFGHFHLRVGNAHFLQIPRRVPGKADHRFHGVVGRAGNGQQFVPRQQQPEQAQGKRRGAAGDGRPHDGAFRPEKPGENPLQSVPADVIVAVARGGGKVPRGNVLRPESVQHPPGVFDFRFLQGGKHGRAVLFRLGNQGVYIHGKHLQKVKSEKWKVKRDQISRLFQLAHMISTNGSRSFPGDQGSH